MKEFDYNASLSRLQLHINNIKKMLETAITKKEVDGKTSNNNGVLYQSGLQAKQSLIRSQHLVYQLHEYVKEEFIAYGVNPDNIYPHLKEDKPETKMSGLFKQKDQDVCVVPSKIENKPEPITWGAMKNENAKTAYGRYKEERILATNVRSQLSSVNKNRDTLFEREFAEATNLHLQYPKLVLGEIYLIPVYEYDDKEMKHENIKFKKKQTDLEKYINFFQFINSYDYSKQNFYAYDFSALIIADFSHKPLPKIYLSIDELKKDGLVSPEYDATFSALSPVRYSYRLLEKYDSIWGFDLLN